MSLTQRLRGLSLKVGPLGENDRLITILTEHEGILKFGAILFLKSLIIIFFP